MKIARYDIFGEFGLENLVSVRPKLTQNVNHHVNTSLLVFIRHMFLCQCCQLSLLPSNIHSAVISVYFIDSSTVNVFVQQADVLLSLGGTQMPSTGLGLGGSQLAPAGLGGNQLALAGLGGSQLAQSGTSVVGSTQQPSTFPALSMPTPMVPLAQSLSQPLSQPQGVGPGQQSPLTSAFSTPLPAGTPSILTGGCHQAHTLSLENGFERQNTIFHILYLF